MIAAKLRTPEQTDWWVRLVMAAFALALALARDLAEDLRHPWEKPPAPDRPLTPAESAAGSGTSNAYWAPQPMFPNPPRSDQDDRKDHAPAQLPAIPSQRKTINKPQQLEAPRSPTHRTRGWQVTRQDPTGPITTRWPGPSTVIAGLPGWPAGLPFAKRPSRGSA
jgi:hypothetical protein